jgi:hypothetical protein
MKKHDVQNVQSYYLDLTTEEIPLDFKGPLVHFQLSPDLFGNDFRIWDQLFLVLLFGFYLKKDGNFVDFLTPFRDPRGTFTYLLLMEVPVLKQEFLTNPEDFPLGLSSPEVTNRVPLYPFALSQGYRPFITVPEKKQNLSVFKIEDKLEVWLNKLFGEDPPQTYKSLVLVLGRVFFGPDYHCEFHDLRILVNVQNYFTKLIPLLPEGNVDIFPSKG